MLRTVGLWVEASACFISLLSLFKMATELSESLLAHQTQREIPVKCGPIEGSIWTDFLGGRLGEGSIKCIYCSTKSNYWDRRLLLAARFTLKSFEKYNLYLREDLPLQVHQSSNRKSPKSPQHEKVALSDAVSVPTDRDSTCDVMDGSTKWILLHQIV